MSATDRPLCRTCAHFCTKWTPNGARYDCANAAFPRTIDLVTGQVTLPRAGAMRARADACGEEGAGYARAGALGRFLAWIDMPR